MSLISELQHHCLAMTSTRSSAIEIVVGISLGRYSIANIYKQVHNCTIKRMVVSCHAHYLQAVLRHSVTALSGRDMSVIVSRLTFRTTASATARPALCSHPISEWRRYCNRLARVLFCRAVVIRVRSGLLDLQQVHRAAIMFQRYRIS